MSDEITIQAVNGKPMVNFRASSIGEPQGLADKIARDAKNVSQPTARKLGKAFALLVASRMPPQNETNRSNLSKYADQYYIRLATPEANLSFDDGFNEAVDEMLQAIAKSENHIEVLARKLGFVD
jgi:hypothetical protein